MRSFAWLARLAFFALALWFALQNTTPVPLYLTDTLRWDDVPLILIIVGCLAIGVLAGAAAMAPSLFRLRRQLKAAAGRTAVAPPAAAAAARDGDRLASAARNAGAAGQLDGDTQSPR